LCCHNHLNLVFMDECYCYNLADGDEWIF